MANNALAEATNAKKVATNYIGYGSNGLLIGNLTETTLGRNVLIDSTSVNIRAGETILASFGEDLIELGKASVQSKISFCNGKGTIFMETEEGVYNILTLETTNTLKLRSASARIVANTITLEGNTRTQGDIEVVGWVGCHTLTSNYAEMTLASVAGILTIGSKDVLGALVVEGTVNATGDTTLASLTVSGATTLSGTTTAGRINASNVYLSGSLYVGGKSSTTDGKTGVAFGASGNITMQGSSAPTLNWV